MTVNTQERLERLGSANRTLVMEWLDTVENDSENADRVDVVAGFGREGA
jgi:hypothetical protein